LVPIKRPKAKIALRLKPIGKAIHPMQTLVYYPKLDEGALDLMTSDCSYFAKGIAGHNFSSFMISHRSESAESYEEDMIRTHGPKAAPIETNLVRARMASFT
jgi:hypothetical protein